MLHSSHGRRDVTADLTVADLLDLAQRLAHHAAHMPSCAHRINPTCCCGLDQLLADTVAAGIYVQPHSPTRPAPDTDADRAHRAHMRTLTEPTKGDM